MKIFHKLGSSALDRRPLRLQEDVCVRFGDNFYHCTGGAKPTPSDSEGFQSSVWGRASVAAGKQAGPRVRRPRTQPTAGVRVARPSHRFEVGRGIGAHTRSGLGRR